MTRLPFREFWRLLATLPRHAPDRSYPTWHRSTGDGVAFLVAQDANLQIRPLGDSPSSPFPAPANGLG